MTGHKPQVGSLVQVNPNTFIGTGTNRRHIGGEYMTVTDTTVDRNGELAVCLSHSHTVGDEDIWLMASQIQEVGRW